MTSFLPSISTCLLPYRSKKKEEGFRLAGSPFWSDKGHIDKAFLHLDAIDTRNIFLIQGEVCFKIFNKL